MILVTHTIIPLSEVSCVLGPVLRTYVNPHHKKSKTDMIISATLQIYKLRLERIIRELSRSPLSPGTASF